MPDCAERAAHALWRAQEAVAVAEQAIERAGEVLQQGSPTRTCPRPAAVDAATEAVLRERLTRPEPT
jgi:hypothetical protein